MYTPRFAISIISTATGNGIIDCGTSDLRTAKGAVNNWLNTCGHVIGSFLSNENQLAPPYGFGIKIIARPIEVQEDAICIAVQRINANNYIRREERNGATAFDFTRD